jgi:hypothetical protein
MRRIREDGAVVSIVGEFTGDGDSVPVRFMSYAFPAVSDEVALEPEQRDESKWSCSTSYISR